MRFEVSKRRVRNVTAFQETGNEVESFRKISCLFKMKSTDAKYHVG